MANIRERADRRQYPVGGGKRPARGPVRAPLQQRNRRRGWWIAGGVVVVWLGADSLTGSFLGATVLLVVVAVLAVIAVHGLRVMGITPDHPWLRLLRTRPWRRGRSVLNAAVRHLSEVLVVTPSGSLVAPDIVELQMNPDDVARLRQWMELDVIGDSVTESYRNQVAASSARFAGSDQPEVYIAANDAVPQGRFRLLRGLPPQSRPAPDYRDDYQGAYQGAYQDGYQDAPDYRDGYRDAPDYQGAYPNGPDYAGRAYGADSAGYFLGDDGGYDRGYGGDGGDGGYGGDRDGDRADREYAPPVAEPVYYDDEPADRGQPAADPNRTVMDGMATVLEQIRPAVPRLRLVTGALVSETTMSGARAGRGAVELELPDVPTVSRVHATFTFASGCWWVANEGVNGLSLNGAQVAGKQALKDGDSIRWGKRSDAPQSRVEIG